MRHLSGTGGERHAREGQPLRRRGAGSCDCPDDCAGHLPDSQGENEIRQEKGGSQRVNVIKLRF